MLRIQKQQALLLCIVLVFLFSVSNVFAYSIIGNNITEEDVFSKILVYPHTASNPTGQNFVQTFELTNKTNSLQNVYIAYQFGLPLVSGKIEYYNPPVFGDINYTLKCDYNYVYSLGNSGDINNPNKLHCYKILHSDVNAGGLDYNVTIFDTNFCVGNIAQKTVKHCGFGLKSGNTWTNVTSILDNYSTTKKSYYYTPTALIFNPNETKKWKITYTPNINDIDKKWVMYYYTGTNANCILNNTCSYTNVLDPWWNASWLSKKPITICPLIDLNVGMQIWVKDINWSALTVQANLQDVRVVDDLTNIEMTPRLVDGTSTSIDGNLFFSIDKNIKKGTCDQNFYVYYNNSSATAPPNLSYMTEGFETWQTGFTATPSNQGFGYFYGTTAGMETNGGNPEFTVSIDDPKNGVKSGYYKNGTDVSYTFAQYRRLIPSFDTNLAGKTIDYNYWFKPIHTGTYYNGLAKQGDTVTARLIWNAGSIRTENEDTLIGSFSIGNWYQVNMKYQWGATTYDVCVFSETAKIGCSTGENTSSAASMEVPTYLDITNTGSTEESYFDDIQFFAPYSTNTYFNANGIATNVIDLNILSFKNIDINTYIKQGDVRILDFNLHSEDYNAVDFLFDINISASRVEGTGKPILNDGNVASTPKVYCDSNTLYNASPTICHYYWDVNISYDGNAFLIVKAISPIDSVTVYSDKNFNIAGLSRYTILVPKDELTSLPITPYTLIVSGGADYNFSELTTSIDINWLIPTSTIYLDFNASGYVSKRYTITDTTTVITPAPQLQPYLTPIGTTMQVTISVLSGSLTGIPGILILSTKKIGGVDTNIQTATTDSAGNVLMNFHQGDSYTLLLYSNGTLLKSVSYTAITSTFVIYLSTGIYLPQEVISNYFDLNWFSNTCVMDNNHLDFNQQIRLIAYNGATISSIDVNVIQNDKNLFYDHNTSITSADWLYQDINLNKPGLSFFSYGYPVIINYKVITSDGNTYVFNYTYNVFSCGDCTWNGNTPLDDAFYARCAAKWKTNLIVTMPALFNGTNPNKPTTTLIALIVSIIATLGVTMRTSFDMQGAGFIFVALFTVFGVIGWVDWMLIAVSYAAVIAIVLAWRTR